MDDSSSWRAHPIIRLISITYEGSTRLGAISSKVASEKPAPDRWSPAEELGHLIDSAMVNHQRFLRTVLEDEPALPTYDQERWVQLQRYHKLRWIDLIRLWLSLNEHMFLTLEKVEDDAWDRVCTIGDSAPMTLRELVESYIDHILHHLGHIGIKVDDFGPPVEGKRVWVYPEKTAETEYMINELIQRRWSPRAFSKEEIDPHLIRTLLEAARWAPSCFNEQPWRYIVFDGSDPVAMKQAWSCLSEGNEWARGAPVLMLSVAKETFTHNGKTNRTAHHDVGLASENLVLEAVEYGLAAHQMAGFDVERAREVFSIPEDFTPVAMMAIGYPYRGSLDDLPEDLRKKELAPRYRRPLDEIAFSGRWGKPYTD